LVIDITKAGDLRKKIDAYLQKIYLPISIFICKAIGYKKSAPGKNSRGDRMCDASFSGSIHSAYKPGFI